MSVTTLKDKAYRSQRRISHEHKPPLSMVSSSTYSKRFVKCGLVFRYT